MNADPHADARARSFLAVAVPFALVLGLWIAAVLWLCGGAWSFSLDDAYIHLAIAEHWSPDHYGIHVGERSAPGSSPLWPLLLAPVAGGGLGPWVALAWNLGAAFACLWLWHDLAWRCLGPERPRAVWLGTAVAVVASNLVGLVFTGMEHTLQLALALAILRGLSLPGRAGLALWGPLVVLPWLRYEGLALTAPALAWLFLRGERGRALAAGALCAAGLGLFSWHLHQQGLGWLPTSVVSKSTAVAGGGRLGALWLGLQRNLETWPGIVLAVSAVGLARAAAQARRPARERLLAAWAAAACLAHLVGGRTGSLSRYEIHVWAAALGSAAWLERARLRRWVDAGRPALAAAAGLLLLTWPYAYASLFSPMYAHEIHRQQGQMRRLAAEVWRAPVAVNDIGFVSWRNPHYVLDLWGLASHRALEARRARRGPAWMDALAREHGVELAMIFDGWFPERPARWQRLGELRMRRIRPGSGRPPVAFYAVEPARVPQLRAALARWSEGLPPGASFAFAAPAPAATGAR